VAKNDNLTDFLKGLADKFRSVLGTADPLNPQEFEDKIQTVRDEAYSQGFAEGGPTGITATAPDVLSGKVFGSGGSAKATGTMPDRGEYQYGHFGSGPNYVSITSLPEGYYHSDGHSWAPEARVPNSDMASGIGLTAAKLLKGQTVLGITGTGFTRPFYVGYNLYPTHGTFNAGKAPYSGTLRFYWGGCGKGSDKTNIDVHCDSNNGINRETFHSEFSGKVELKVTKGKDVTFTVGGKSPYLVIAYYIS
jgi:hypothetical protein